MLDCFSSLCCHNFYGTLNKELFNQKNWFQIVSLETVLKNNPQITYKKVYDKVFFEYPEFSISPKYPCKGSFDELFVLIIPNGRVQGLCGHVFIDDLLPDEFARADRYDGLFAPKLEGHDFFKLSGKVAVIAQHGAGQYWANYYHALYEVFGRLAILEMSGVDYDWLYVPLDKKYVREILELWNIDFSKIISPNSEYCGIKADELILPSLVINTDVGYKQCGDFQHPIVMQYIKEKLLLAAQNRGIDASLFSKRVFISRSDCYQSRRIANEDDIFELLEKKDFNRYKLSDLSVAEQLILFNNADIVIAEHGAGLANILFCQQNTRIIEIFQAMIGMHYWWVSSVFGLNYTPIKTLDVYVDYFANWWDRGIQNLEISGGSIVDVPLTRIKDCIKDL